MKKVKQLHNDILRQDAQAPFRFINIWGTKTTVQMSFKTRDDALAAKERLGGIISAMSEPVMKQSIVFDYRKQPAGVFRIITRKRKGFMLTVPVK